MKINNKIPLNLDTKKIILDKFQNLKHLKNDDKRLKEACDDFEAFFMQQFLEISLKNTKIAGEAVGSEIIKGMYAESLSKAGSGSVGISDMLYKFLTQQLKAKHGK